MASGRLGAKDIDGTTNAVSTDIAAYVVPATTLSSFNIKVCNRSAVNALVRLALIDGAIGDIVPEDYIEYDVILPANGGVLEHTGLLLSSADTVLFRSNVVDVNCVIMGIEETV